MDQAKEQADHRGLALPRRADDRHDLAGGSTERRIHNDRLILLIGKAHILHPQLKALVGQSLQFSALRDVFLPRQLDQLTDTVGRNRAVQERRNDAYHVVEGRGKAGALLQKERHGAIGDLVAPKQIQAVAKGGILHQQPQHRHEDIRLYGKEIVIQADGLHLLLPGAQLAPIGFHHAKGLDGVEVGKGIHLKGHHLAAGLFDLAGVFPLLTHQILAHQQHDRRTGKGQQAHHLVVMPDERKGHHEIIERDHDGRQPADRVFADRAHIAVEAVEQIAAAVGVDRLPVHIHDLIEDIGLNVIVDVQADFCGQTADQAGEEQAEGRAAQHKGDHQSQLAGLIAGNDIDGIFAGHAGHEAEGGADDTKQRVEQDRPLIALCVPKDPAPVLQDLMKAAVLPALAERMQGVKKRPVFVSFLIHAFTLPSMDDTPHSHSCYCIITISVLQEKTRRFT